MRLQADGSPMNPNDPGAIIWECMDTLSIPGPISIHIAQNMTPVRRAFTALFAAEMELDAAREDVHLLAVVKRVRKRVLTAVELCVSGQYRA